MTTDARPARAPRFNILRTIAVYKLVKVLLLVALAMQFFVNGLTDLGLIPRR